MAVFCKSYENVLIRVFLHAEFIFTQKTEPKSMVFEKYAKNEKKKIFIIIIFLFFVIFSKRFKQKFVIPTESCFLHGKKPNIAKLVDINFLADSVKNRQAISFAKIQGYMAVFCKYYENVLIRVFLQAEFISALKTEPKSMFFFKICKKWKKKYLLSLFSIFFVIFFKSFKQKFLIPTESCFLDGKKPNIAKLVYINFLADSVKNRQSIPFAKIPR